MKLLFGARHLLFGGCELPKCRGSLTQNSDTLLAEQAVKLVG